MTTHAAPVRGALSRTAQRLLDYSALIRLEYLPLMSTPFLLGPVIAAQRVSGTALAWFGVGCALHALSCSSNDIADRHLDAQDPRRANRPLTSGRLPVRHAVALTVLLGALFVVGSVFLPSEHPGYLYVSLAITLWGNVRQKRSRVPAPVSDLLWGLSVSMPLLAFIAVPGIAEVTAVMAFALLLATFDASGADLKDLETDLRLGIRTTGVLLGLTAAENGAATTRRFRLAVLISHALMSALCVLALVTAGTGTALRSAGAAALVLSVWPLLRHTMADTVRRGGRSVLFLGGPFVAYLCTAAALATRPARVAAAMGVVVGATAGAVLWHGALRRFVSRATTDVAPAGPASFEPAREPPRRLRDHGP
ncbi:UbiA family prenyltransferase [Streptomyces sp. AK02-01A]|uniref:UbiA family prenyltransferase n=1 Tax=Streptomyces sp. AK02-01A TaxID=3028648 RepID=UPI0029A58C58|nr:UbiA family prenyltransferase [Streptomyces sp. AK02-01A]MDX3854753.1 UbiA family prenyltransferase [Streptomyces sp. AK02-01A]